MKLKAGDYIELEGVSEEQLKQVRDAFVAAGFDNRYGLSGRIDWEAFGAIDDDDCCFLNIKSIDAKRLLTIDQVLEEAHQQVVQATPEVSEEEEEVFVVMSDKSKSDGSTASYYELPKGATEIQHLISDRDMNAQIGEIFRSCYRYGQASHSDRMRDAKKIKFYIDAEIARLELL